MPDYVISIASPIAVKDHFFKNVVCDIQHGFVVFYKEDDHSDLIKAFPSHVVVHVRMKGETNEDPD